MDRAKYFDKKPIKGMIQNAIAEGTAAALQLFCDQEPELLQAIEQSGRSFQECLDAVAGSVGKARSISDLAAYQKAVEFYFPGAQVRFVMRIDLVGDAAESSGLSFCCVDLDSLLDF